MARDWLKEDRKELERTKRHLRDVKEVLGYMLICFEKMAKPRVQYKRVRFALKTAISAVEKQTPKKVLDYKCPVCGRLVGFTHCERCGQRLEW